MRLLKYFFSPSNDVYLCCAYISPTYSSYTARHSLDSLSLMEKDISHCSSLGDIMICGDAHAQTGIKTDFVDNSNTYISVSYYTNCSGSIKYRNSKDLVCAPR